MSLLKELQKLEEEELQAALQEKTDADEAAKAEAKAKKDAEAAKRKADNNAKRKAASAQKAAEAAARKAAEQDCPVFKEKQKVLRLEQKLARKKAQEFKCAMALRRCPSLEEAQIAYQAALNEQAALESRLTEAKGIVKECRAQVSAVQKVRHAKARTDAKCAALTRELKIALAAHEKAQRDAVPAMSIAASLDEIGRPEDLPDCTNKPRRCRAIESDDDEEAVSKCSSSKEGNEFTADYDACVCGDEHGPDVCTCSKHNHVCSGTPPVGTIILDPPTCPFEECEFLAHCTTCGKSLYNGNEKDEESSSDGLSSVCACCVFKEHVCTANSQCKHAVTACPKCGTAQNCEDCGEDFVPLTDDSSVEIVPTPPGSPVVKAAPTEHAVCSCRLYADCECDGVPGTFTPPAHNLCGLCKGTWFCHKCGQAFLPMSRACPMDLSDEESVGEPASLPSTVDPDEGSVCGKRDEPDSDEAAILAAEIEVEERELALQKRKLALLRLQGSRKKARAAGVDAGAGAGGV